MTKMIQSDENAPLISQKSAGPEKVHKGWGYRHVLAFLAFFGFFNVYCMRVNLSVAMVDMVKHINDSNNSTSDECPDSNTVNSTKEHVGEFGWSRDLQGYVLGSFFYGYILTQIPGGYLAEKFGAKFLFGFGVLCTAVFTLLTPLAARWNVGVFIAVRVLEGLGEGVTFPAMHAMWGKWGPLYERSKLTGFSYTGAQMGTVISMPISAYLCDSGFLGGWPSVFYVFGALACVWFILWMMMAYNTPADHPHISVEEREYIESSVGRKEFAGCNHTVIVALLVLCLTAGGFTMGGFQVNHIDLSPNFAGVLMGMSNTWATIPGFLGPEVVGWLTTKHDTRQQWQIVFYIAAAVYISGAIIYCIFARGTEQPWNNLEQSQGVSFKRAVDTEVSVNRNRGTDREKRLVTVSYD
ncbi:S17A5-like protein [Mya arenaria]|uniref:S17A5-like protein n=1 Tax=Mya arenaria TaxID=6604 RepID=A0ABY7F574_MYAAR|nr:S17A5-like protein [Mya arenaria]